MGLGPVYTTDVFLYPRHCNLELRIFYFLQCLPGYECYSFISNCLQFYATVKSFKVEKLQLKV